MPILGGNARRVPRTTAGTTGHPALAAATNAPVWNFSRPGSCENVPSGKNTSECPLVALRIIRRASAAPRWRLKRSTNSRAEAPQAEIPASGTRDISRLITNPNRGGSAAVITIPSR